MSRPWQSEMYMSAIDSLTVEYDPYITLMPDVVTDTAAYIVGHFLGKRGTISLLEVGCGVAPFLSLASRRLPIGSVSQETGIEIDSRAIPFAEYNVGDKDVPNLRNVDWNEFEFLANTYDAVYFNPPYLRPDQSVRDAYMQTPRNAMYVEGSVDGMEHYRSLVSLLASSLREGGILIVRTPKEATSFDKVKRIGLEQTGEGFTLHEVKVRSELGDREGRLLIIQKELVDSQQFVVEPVRAVGLALRRTAA